MLYTMVRLAEQFTGLERVFGGNGRLTGLPAMVEEHAQTLRNNPVLFAQWAMSDRVSSRQVAELRALCSHLMEINDTYSDFAARLQDHLLTKAPATEQVPVAAESGRRGLRVA